MLKTFTFIWNHPISSRNRFAAYKRWLRWQVGSRLLKNSIIIPWMENSILVVDPGMTGATGNIYCGLHEFYDMGFLLHFLRKGDKFADIGANVGTYTILASFVVGAETQAFEPLPATYAKLLRNVAINKLSGSHGHVTANMVACGKENGTVNFTADLDTMNQVVSEDFQGKTVLVPVMRLDELLAEFNAALWKIDVEGYEEQVIDGALERLSNSELKAVILETETPAIIKILQENGFEKGYYDPFTRRFDIPIREGSSNQLWIRDKTYCENQVRESPEFIINGVKV